MTHKIGILSILFISLVLPIVANPAKNNSRPSFKDFLTTDIYQGINADIILTKEDRGFRTRLREGSRKRPKFAGYYVLTIWGAGCGAISGAVIDVKTGKVYWLPGSVCCMNPSITGVPDTEDLVIYKPNSKLIIFNGLIGETGINGSHYYKFENQKFIHIKTIETPRPKLDDE